MTSLAPDAYADGVVDIGVTGALRFGSTLGLTFPVGMGAFSSDFADAGWISDEGITENRETDSTPFIPWQTTSPIRIATASETLTWETVIWSNTFEVVSLWYKTKAADMTDTDDVISFTDGDIKDQDFRPFGIDIIDGVKHRRFEIPKGEVTARGSQTFKKGELIGYPVTVTAHPGAEGWSVKRKFLNVFSLPDLTP
jgi:hypothetical protein